MNHYLITLGKGDYDHACGPRTLEWTLMNATSLDVDPGKDLVRCRFTGTMMRVVMRFKAPDWESARDIFYWKAGEDRKVPKHLLEWEEAKLLMEPSHVQEKAQVSPGPCAV